jgi:hypothetical protein
VSQDKNVWQKLFVWAIFKENKGNKSVYDAYVFDESGKIWIKLKNYQMIG